MRLTPYNIQKGFRFLKNYGVKEFFVRLREKAEPEHVSYKEWYIKHRPHKRKYKKNNFSNCIMFNNPNCVLDECCQFEFGQAFSNAGEKASVLVYSDGDFRGEEPDFKSDYNLDMLRSRDYISYCFAINYELAQQVFGDTDEVRLQKIYDDNPYDFMFRCIEKCQNIVHIEKVLYHMSISDFDQNKFVASVQAHLDRQKIDAIAMADETTGLCRVRYSLNSEDKISIIIPNKDQPDTLRQCINSIKKSSYSNYEIIIVENNSVENSIFELYEELEREEDIEIKVVKYKSAGAFNYSALNNYGASFAGGDYLILLNNDIEIITEDWMEELLSVCQRPEVGIVGAKLYYPDDTIQHAGIMVAVGGSARGVACNMLTNLPRTQGGYQNRARIMSDFSAVTAACLMIKRDVFDMVEGLTEQLAVAFNDVDLCLKVRKNNFLVVFDPYVEAYHYESKTRGIEDTEEKVRRFQSEIEYMRTNWNYILRYGDPYYNSAFSRIKNDYSINGLN